MKAIICTQCGATIEDVSEHSVIVDCEYCGARMLMSELKEKPKAPVQVAPPDLGVEENGLSPAARVGIVVAVGVLVPALIMIFAATKRDPRPSSAADRTVSATPYTSPSPSSSSSSWMVPAKPLPIVNYQPRVSWDGPNDLEYFDDPQVDVSSVSDLTSEEVKKTVFKNRIVKLRVVINTSGEIDEVETISGHPILVAAATESAKRSIFSARSKPTKRVLTYTFRLLKD